MAATTTSVRPNRSPRVRLVWIVPVVVAIAVAVLVVNLSTELPSRETLTVRNPTAAPVTVHVSCQPPTLDAKEAKKIEPAEWKKRPFYKTYFDNLAGLTSGCPEMTRETDETATPASCATSRMFERPGMPWRASPGWSMANRRNGRRRQSRRTSGHLFRSRSSPTRRIELGRKLSHFAWSSICPF